MEEVIDLDKFYLTAHKHANDPHNLGVLDDFNGHARIKGPCSDTMEFWLDVQNSQIKKVSFVTDGCAPSLASGSMATCLAEGKTVEEAKAITQQDIIKGLGGLPDESQHCALLAANTLKAACEDYLTGQKQKQADDVQSEKKTCDTCGDSSCSAKKQQKDESPEEYADRRKLQAAMCRIRHKIVVLSGKGGVGKSTVAVNLATALMLSGQRVGLLDVDIHGPSVPTMLGLEHETLNGGPGGLFPVELEKMKVMSLGFLLQNPDDAVIWRGPMKMSVIKQFLTDVHWGDLDYLIVDAPPGTGDEPLSVCQLMQPLSGAIIVTTPQRVAAVDVRRSISFCRRLDVPVLGVIENMSGFVCPKCGEITQILPEGGGRKIATDMKVPFWGAIPMDPVVAQSSDAGRAFINHYTASPTAKIMRDILNQIIVLDKTKKLN
jgi:ATP-binding protein involved in chromosome partitioning